MMVNSRLDDGSPSRGMSVGPAKARVNGFVRWALPLLAGALVWAAPGESEAAERCHTKPAVCARLKAQRAARAAPPARQEVAAATPRCSTKPVVCARLAAMGARPPAAPVTLASSSDRCTTKPAVCARLRMRPSSNPLTFANTPAAPEAVD